MTRPAKMGEIKAAALRLGVASSMLRQQGWKTASEARIGAVESDCPDWLIVGRQRLANKRDRAERARQRREQGQDGAATRSRRAHLEQRDLEIADAYLRAVKDRGDTDSWAAGVLHLAGIHTVEYDGVEYPVLSRQPLRLVRSE